MESQVYANVFSILSFSMAEITVQYKNKCFFECAFKFPIGNVNFAAGSYIRSLENRLCNMFYNNRDTLL